MTEDANPFENERVYREIVASRMKADPLFYARMHMLSIVKMFTNLSTSSISTQLRLPAGGLPYDYYSSPTIAGMVGGFLRTKSIHEVVAAGVVAIVLALTYLSALVGVVSSLRERKYFYLATTLLIILYFAAAIGPMGQARYRLPLACYYIAWSGLGCLEIHGWIQRRWRLRSERRLASADGRCAKR